MNGIAVYIGLGSNLHQPVQQLAAAVGLMAGQPGIELARVSSFYGSAPVGDDYQGQPDYVNAVACVSTLLSAREMLDLLLGIELRCGRSRELTHAARTLDLDLLLYGEQEVDQPGLQVPHPRMHERAFVLEPLFEIAPQAVIPGRGPVALLREMCHHQRLTRLEFA